MFALYLSLFLLKVSGAMCDQTCDCREINLLKDVVQKNILEQKLEFSRILAKIRSLEGAQQLKQAFVDEQGICTAANSEKIEDMDRKLDQLLNTNSRERSSIIKMGLKAEKQERMELSSKIESQMLNMSETLDRHKEETLKMAEQCKSNINSLKDVLEQDVNSTLSVMREQINVKHESVFSELVKLKHHLDKKDVLISRVDDTAFRSKIDGNWANWGSWSSCSVTCGSGIREKTRTCTNPEPSLFGRQCEGNSHMVNDCNNNMCPVCMNGWEEFGTSCYLFSTKLLGWEAAEKYTVQCLSFKTYRGAEVELRNVFTSKKKKYCETLGANLAIVKERAEHEFIRDRIKGEPYANWIGARFNEYYGEHRWIDNSGMTLDFWGPNRPGNVKGCVDYLHSFDYMWNTHPDCVYTRIRFICEKDYSIADK